MIGGAATLPAGAAAAGPGPASVPVRGPASYGVTAAQPVGLAPAKPAAAVKAPGQHVPVPAAGVKTHPVGGPATFAPAVVPKIPAPNANLVFGFNAASASSAGSTFTPPDDNLAVSPSFVAEAVNSSLMVYDRSGAPLGSPINLGALLALSGCPGAALSDPRVLYDSATQRWWLSGVLIDNFNDSCIVVAVSPPAPTTTPPPATGWFVYQAPSVSTPGSGYTNRILLDQPKIGYSDDKVTVSWTDFNCLNDPFCNAYLGEETVVLEKSQMLGNSAVSWANLFQRDPARFGLVPVQSLGSTSDQWIVYNNADPSLNQNQRTPTLGTIRVIGSPAARTIGIAEYDPQIAPMTFPPDAAQPAGPNLSTGDDRLLGATFLNGLVWTTATVGCGGRSCGRFIQVITTPSNVAVAQDFTVGSSNADYHYPAASFDSNGDMMGAMTLSNSTTYAGVVAIGQARGYSGSPTFSTTVVNGTGPYSACTPSPACQSQSQRWGDYSGAALDPADPSGVWIVDEYKLAGTLSDWNTYIEHLSVTGTPSPGGGYTMDAYGGVHAQGDAPQEPYSGYWPGRRIAKAMKLDPCDVTGHSGWVLDGLGGLNAFGAAPPISTGRWSWDIANDFVALPCAAGNHRTGYILDGFGGMHAWGDAGATLPAAAATTAYWDGWNIAIKVVLIPGTNRGWVMDGYAGLHPFNSAPPETAGPYWNNWRIARDVVAVGSNGGYILDGFGGIAPFNNATSVPPSGYWNGWDIARGITAVSATTGYTLDGYGGLHPYGGLPLRSTTGYFPGQDLVRCIA